MNYRELLTHALAEIDRLSDEGGSNVAEQIRSALEQPSPMPIVERISYGTGADWWWHKTDCPKGTKLYTTEQNAMAPKEWALVPKKPTPKMIMASWDMAGVSWDQEKYIAIAWDSMIAAAPNYTPPNPKD